MGSEVTGSTAGDGSMAEARATGSLEGSTVAGKYLIDRLIGEGGMGAVYAGRNLLTDRQVALKWLSPDRAREADALARFRREALAAGRIDHPNVIQVYDVLEEDDGSVFLVMELLHGEPLSNVVLRMGGEIAVSDAVSLLVPAMRGLAAAHERGVVHRDLKPENIFLCRGDDGMVASVKVLDFGVSKLQSEHENLSLTTTGMVVGTPYYMSPEQVRGMRDLDHRVDVYAMGVVLYELLSGQPPFDAGSYSALMVEIATSTAPPLHTLCELDPEVERIVERAMARDREDRFPDMESLAVALEPYAPGVTFRQTRPDGTARISIPKSSGAPHASRARVSSRAATALLGGTGPRPRAKGASGAAVEAAEEGGLDTAGTLEAPTLARAEPARPARGRRLPVALLLLVAALGLVAVLWARSPSGLDAPATGAEGPVDTAGAGGDALEVAAEAALPTAHEPSGPVADAVEDVAPEEPAPEVDETEVSPPARAARKSPRVRAARAPAAKRPEAAAPTAPAPVRSRTPRAGSLSLDDF
jgi:eukaryotic-like serine/threonine-protein kinase